VLEVGDRIEVRFYIVPWKLYTAFADGALAVKPGERSGGEAEDHWAGRWSDMFSQNPLCSMPR